MKVNEVVKTNEAVMGFRDEVSDILWTHYQQDGLFPVELEYPEQMDDEDFAEYEQHIDDIVDYAKLHHIKKPALAIAAYTSALRTQHAPTIH